MFRSTLVVSVFLQHFAFSDMTQQIYHPNHKCMSLRIESSFCASNIAGTRIVQSLFGGLLVRRTNAALVMTNIYNETNEMKTPRKNCQHKKTIRVTRAKNQKIVLSVIVEVKSNLRRKLRLASQTETETQSVAALQLQPVSSCYVMIYYPCKWHCVTRTYLTQAMPPNAMSQVSVLFCM